MFNVGAGEMIVIALILLMAVGPEQLPGLIRRVGRTVSEVKGMTEGLRAEFMSGMEEIERATDPEAWAAGNGVQSNVKPRTRPDPAPGSVADQERKAAAGDGETDPEDNAGGDSDDPSDGVASDDGADLDDSVLDSTDQGDTARGAVDDWASKIGNGWDSPDPDEPVFPAADEAAASETSEAPGETDASDVDATDSSRPAEADGAGSEEQP